MPSLRGERPSGLLLDAGRCIFMRASALRNSATEHRFSLPTTWVRHAQITPICAP